MYKEEIIQIKCVEKRRQTSFHFPCSGFFPPWLVTNDSVSTNSIFSRVFYFVIHILAAVRLGLVFPLQLDTQDTSGNVALFLFFQPLVFILWHCAISVITVGDVIHSRIYFCLFVCVGGCSVGGTLMCRKDLSQSWEEEEEGGGGNYCTARSDVFDWQEDPICGCTRHCK